MRKTVTARASLYLARIRRITLVDTQAVREKLLRQLEGLFDLACLIAKGKVKRLRDEAGEEVKVTLKMREKWARIAAYTAQVMSSLALGFDEKELKDDVKKLQDMVNEVMRHRKAQENSQGPVPGRI